jgi:hypothetical protein
MRQVLYTCDWCKATHVCNEPSLPHEWQSFNELWTLRGETLCGRCCDRLKRAVQEARTRANE